MAAAAISEASSGIRRHQLCRAGPILFPGLWRVRRRWNNNHGSEFWSVLITSPFHQPSCNFDRQASTFFLSLDVIGGNFAAGLNSGILDTKQTEAGAFHFGRRRRLSGWVRLREIECDLVSTRQRRGKKGLATYGERMRGRNLVYFSRDNRAAEVLNIKFRR